MPYMLAETSHNLPIVGFGTFLIKPFQTKKTVLTALQLGYRHIDTAQVCHSLLYERENFNAHAAPQLTSKPLQLYGNEREVGLAVQASAIPRRDIFITTKLWESEWGYRKATGAIQDRLATLDVDYIDLLLLHAPGNPNLRAETWRALEDAHNQGHLKRIGVSNFGVGQLKKLLQTAKTIPAVNQMELTPFLQRKKLVDYCLSEGITLEAYSPLCKGSSSKINHPTISRIAEELNVSPAQVLIRWSLQKGFVPLPKSTNVDRIRQNISVYEFQLDEAQMHDLDQLESNFVTAWDPSETDPI